MEQRGDREDADDEREDEHKLGPGPLVQDHFANVRSESQLDRAGGTRIPRKLPRCAPRFCIDRALPCLCLNPAPPARPRPHHLLYYYSCPLKSGLPPTKTTTNPTCYADAPANSDDEPRPLHSQKEETSASLYWCVTPEEVEQRILQRKPNQRVGRIPGMYVLCNKVTAPPRTPHRHPLPLQLPSSLPLHTSTSCGQAMMPEP